ncbi:DUF6311 domain-containing protein [Candidatus Saccharibacteria bacterium]|nr:DUF6311 domain-containing protein [Candidatus Saccharibacteria bacterium]
MKGKIVKFLSSGWGAFVLGGIIGVIFFAMQFGLAVVNPLATDWIWHGVTHDTAQHFLGWEFFRAGSDGAVITGLAYPVGLPLTFMDAIPLLALPLKLFIGILPASFQYFGLWALLCYVLQGAIAAVLVQKMWRKIFSSRHSKLGRSVRNEPLESRKKKKISKSDAKFDWILDQVRDDKAGNLWQIIFVAAGALIFVMAPMMIARSLYHPALAAQWLVLLGVLLVWDAAKFVKLWKFVAVWSAMLVGAVLIHPYFLPILGAMMLIASLRNFTKFDWRVFIKLLIKIFVPVVLAGVVFVIIGGFAIGSGAEIRDLHEKGFNLLSFANPSGHSIIPGFPNASSSPETMMWLGLGIWLMVIAAVVFWFGNYKKSIREFRSKFALHKTRNTAITIVVFGLLIFAIGVRVDLGPITLFQYNVPDKIYEIWSAFRAAARFAWPLYYAGVLATIYWFARGLQLRFEKKNFTAIIALVLLIISLVQFVDIWFSSRATARREGFTTARTTAPEFVAPNIGDLITTQRNMIALDAGFRGDMRGFYKLGQAALQNNLTLNIGFFARVPEEIWEQQEVWRNKVVRGNLTACDLTNNIFVTKDEEIVRQASEKYAVEKRGDFYFIMSRN